MLPKEHQQIYSSFQQLLVHLHDRLSSESFDRAAFQTAETEAQTVFQTQIRSLSLDGLSDTEAHRVESIWVEIDKQLRLLKMDGSFIKTAKQPETLRQRLDQARSRVEKLLAYCTLLEQIY